MCFFEENVPSLLLHTASQLEERKLLPWFIGDELKPKKKCIVMLFLQFKVL